MTGRLSSRVADFLWILPVIFLAYLVMNPVSFYFEEIDLYVPELTCYCMILGATVFLIGCQRLQGHFTDNILISALYYSSPMFLVLILVFAQYHPIIVCALAALAILGGLYLSSSTLFNPRVRLKTKVLTFSRGLLVTMAVAFLIPSMLSIFLYDMGTPSYDYERLSEIYAEIFGETAKSGDVFPKEEEIQNNAEIVDNLQESKWTELSMEEKLITLQFVSNTESHSLGIPEVPISCEKLNGSVLAEYDPGTGILTIDLQHANADLPQEVVDSITHEVYHSYQFAIIASLDGIGEECEDYPYYSQALRWKDNVENYHSDGIQYFDQPLEADARAYSGEAVKAYFPES